MASSLRTGSLVIGRVEPSGPMQPGARSGLDYLRQYSPFGPELDQAQRDQAARVRQSDDEQSSDDDEQGYVGENEWAKLREEVGHEPTKADIAKVVQDSTDPNETISSIKRRLAKAKKEDAADKKEWEKKHGKPAKKPTKASAKKAKAETSRLMNEWPNVGSGGAEVRRIEAKYGTKKAKGNEVSADVARQLEKLYGPGWKTNASLAFGDAAGF